MPKINYDGSFEKTPITASFSEFLENSLKNDSRTAYVDADLMALIGVRDVQKKYPDRVLNTGIMEANLIGVGAGLSVAGFIPYVHSFAAFVTRRAFDQIFISGAYSGNTLHIIGTEPGVKQDFNGGTHMTFEDIAMMRTVPNATVIELTDSNMMRAVLEKTHNMDGIFYYRMPINEIVQVYEDCNDIEIGRGNILLDGSDATIVACGALVAPALSAAEILKKENIHVRVIDMFTIKPLDKKLIIDSARKTGAIVTAENASVCGGLGEAVSSCVAEYCPALVKHVAVKDEFGEVGPENYLFERYGFTAKNLAQQVREIRAEKEKLNG